MRYFRSRKEAAAASRDQREALAAVLAQRVPGLVAAFDGAIKYTPMIADHPEWTDDQCLAFARKWHAVAAERYAKGDPRWNEQIPYCRNVYKVPS